MVIYESVREIIAPPYFSQLFFTIKRLFHCIQNRTHKKRRSNKIKEEKKPTNCVNKNTHTKKKIPIKMAKAILLLSALCIVALANFAHCHPEVVDVEGKVYCDTCRVQFETKLSENLEGTKFF